MWRSRSVKKLTVLLLFIILCAGVPLASFIAHSGSTRNAQAAAPNALPYHEYADGPYTVQGNQIIGADNKPYIFHGIGRDGFEFTCTGGGYIDAAHLAFMGPGTTGNGNTYWFANTVRINLAQNMWFNGIPANQCTAAQYQATVKSVVDTLTADHLNVMIDLMWTDANGQSPGGAQWQQGDAVSVNFWKAVAPIYASYSNVLFEALNEPHPASWTCWLSGCPVVNDTSYVTACTCTKTYSYTGVGEQALVSAIRGTGANNLILVAGMNWGYDLTQVVSGGKSVINGSNIVFDTHPYPYSGKQPTDWDTSFGFLTSTFPVMSAESGEYDCQTTYMSQLIAYFDAHSMGWVAWAWWSQPGSAGCGYPQLVSDYQGTPLASMGTYIYQHFLSYGSGVIPSPTPNPSPTSNPSPSPTPIPSLNGPVSLTWYFAEGRAGAGFREYLTLENPDSNACAVNINYLAQPDGHATYTKAVSVNVPAASRMTEWVDGDLGTSPTGPGISDAAQINVNTAATPNCTGIVAERPMYFNALGTSSGSDVIGLTHLGTNFFFGDLAEGAQPGGGNYSSFITILNPVGGQTATVTAKYYAGGNFITSQQATVPGGSRGTIFPAGIPSRVAVVVTSTQPVAVERPTYFSNINGGNAGTVSGGADVVGVGTLASDWLFAEGYTGGQFQENFVIANVDPANVAASVNINLEFPDGSTKVYPITVKADSQAVWSVNAVAPGTSVSAEITSTGAKIVVEREMFFKYNHNANGRSLQSTGGSDVLGLVGPVAANNYGFAEGYVNVGYDEWLTIQNPTAATETINIAIVNEAGGYYTTSISVVGHSRYTVDITGMVINHLYRSGTGYAGYEISMVVQSPNGAFVAERPIYWNASNTTGGSDVIGYIGG